MPRVADTIAPCNLWRYASIDEPLRSSSRIDGGVHGCKISSDGWCYETVADGYAGAGIIDRGRMFVATRNPCSDRETAAQSRGPRDRSLRLSEAVYRSPRLGARC